LFLFVAGCSSIVCWFLFNLYLNSLENTFIYLNIMHFMCLNLYLYLLFFILFIFLLISMMIYVT